ncbi:DUF1028 domain-containing protein [Bartonella sp. HY406]|uniref:DUF1028 domain-containing protein n=1 Tax=Bartonella sp. HY406 TaxID=2979331 RepID=UPI0021C85C86|nr:DUF1028 domain-containing protein [Bartonella sp. HY406]UXN03635.1 DUF1028 domain-containing protein [Bartonella sp. HY406]
MTFSITARCAQTGQLGIALSSSSIAVGARCPWLQAEIGAVSSQNITLPSLGPRGLVFLKNGDTVDIALQKALAEDPFADYRQVAMIDAEGQTASFSGKQTLGIYHVVSGNNCIGAGNMLANTAVIDAMVQAFENSDGLLAGRLIKALQAAIIAGGEAGPVHSAAVKVVGEQAWPMVDLRVDWHDDAPISALQKLWLDYAPQMDAYMVRALDPRQAPSYGVPGDE